MPVKESKVDNQQIDTPSTTSGAGQYMAWMVGLLLVAVGVAGGSAYYFYDQARDLRLNPQKAAQEEIRVLVEKVSKLILIPPDEQPTIATVADPDRLKDQPFFANAKRGDKVLIYTNARKAILYDPLANKIVEVAPVNIGATAGAATGQ